MKLVLALCGAALVAGCSSVPTQPTQQVQKIEGDCDYTLMDRIERAQQPVLVSRTWVHCPQARDSVKS